MFHLISSLAVFLLQLCSANCPPTSNMFRLFGLIAKYRSSVIVHYCNSGAENYKAGDRINQFLSLLNGSSKLCVAICCSNKIARKNAQNETNNLKLWSVRGTLNGGSFEVPIVKSKSGDTKAGETIN